MSEDVIDRDEVIDIFGALAERRRGCVSSGYWRTARMKRKKSSFRSPEERDAWFAAAWERQRALEARVEKMRAEQAARRESA